ncbi:glucosyltransferase domain-containing protein, partial [Escherichia coli]|nr:glucosyltransferase domain-containing protein [Escherichia coli]
MIANKNKTPFHWFLISVFIYFTPIIMANIHYVDDQGRAIWGYTGWARDGRPLAEMLMIALNFNMHITDLFPFPAILSVFLISVCLYFFSRMFISTDNKFIGLLVPLGILSSPFLIENAMYRFDVLPMFISIALSFSVVIFNFKKTILNISFAALLTLFILSIYQASLNFMLVIILCKYVYMYFNSDSNRHLLTYLIEKTVSLVIGVALYFLVVIPLFLTVVGDPDHPSIKTEGIFSVIYENLKFYLHSISSGIFGESGRVAFIVIFLFFIAMTTFIALKKSIPNKSITGIINFLITITSPVTALILSFATLLPLQHHIDAPRVMIGFSATMLFLFMIVYLFSRETKNSITYILVIPLIYVFGFLCSYTNAMTEEKNITTVLFHQIKNDAFELSGKTNQILIFNGKKKDNDVFVNARNNYPLISRFFPEYFYNWDWPFPYMNRVGVYFKHPGNTNIASVLNEKTFCS